MRMGLRSFALCAGFAGLAAVSQPSLAVPTIVGDTVTIGRYIDGQIIGTRGCCGPFRTLVQTGETDLTAVSLGQNTYVNPEGYFIRIQWWPFGGSGGGLSDHEILIEDIDWIGEPERYISGFGLVTNFPSVTRDLVRFGPDFIGLQVGMLEWIGSSYYYADLVLLTSLRQVPEPATMPLALIGIVGLVGLRRLRKNSQASARDRSAADGLYAAEPARAGQDLPLT